MNRSRQKPRLIYFPRSICLAHNPNESNSIPAVEAIFQTGS